MQIASARRNVTVLALCQGLVNIGTSTMIAEAALVGHMLASDKTLATVPLAAQQLAVMLTTFPASLLMQRIGRRWGFSIGAGFGIAGATMATIAVFQGSFWLFCLGAALTGIHNGFALFYRFAAVDGAGEAWRAKAISYVLAGGVIAAVIGPEMAKATKDLFAPVVFAGSFAALIGVAILAFCLLQFIDIPRPSEAERHGPQRPLAEIMRQPAFAVAALGGMVAYGGMNFIMTATPLAMVACGHGFDSAALVIQWHVLAMFGPSFVTGHIIKRLGVLNVMTAGAGLMAVCVAINLAGVGLVNFWGALVLLGLGWNLLFVGATTLLTETYRPSEKAKVQAVNDFLVFGTVTLASFSAGAAHHILGWESINYGVVPLLALSAMATLWLAHRRRVAPA